MYNNEVMRRVKLIEKHLKGDIEMQFKNSGKWVTLMGNNTDYSVVMSRGVEVREKPVSFDVRFNTYTHYETPQDEDHQQAEKRKSLFTSLKGVIG